MKVYFQKTDPEQKILLSSGKMFSFLPRKDSIAEVLRGPNPSIGLVVTENEWLQGELRKCVQRNVGGIIELTAAEFEEAKKKLNAPPSKNNWREELSASQFTGASRAANRVAVSAPQRGDDVAVKPSGRPQKLDFKPGTTNR